MTSAKVRKVSICVLVTARLQKYGPLEQLAPDYLLLPKHWPDISPTLSQDQTQGNRQCSFHAKLDTKLKYIVFMLQWFSGNFSFLDQVCSLSATKSHLLTWQAMTFQKKKTKQKPKLHQFISPPENKISLQHHFFTLLRLIWNCSYSYRLLFSKSKYNKKQ